VTTSPSINPDYPTTEPRLRERAPHAVAARARAIPRRRPSCPSPTCFLRLCAGADVGVTGTKGKTTTASLAAALLAADPSHPAVLGGNIGVPIVSACPS
jgi:UDP-N-acetylmuramoylalanine-D-glutamate ligase